MKKVIEYIEKYKPNFDDFEMLSDDLIEKAEKKLGFKFDDDIKTFLKYSHISTGPTEFCNLDPDTDDYLNVLSVYDEITSDGDYEIKLPSDKVIPLENYDEFYAVYSFGEGSPKGVYMCNPYQMQKDHDTLEEYILVIFAEAKESLEEDDEWIEDGDEE